MKIRYWLRNLSFKQLIKLFWIAIQYPNFIFSTLKATKNTIRLSTAMYGKAHHKNGKANAFRHALWNAYICKLLFIKRYDPQQCMNWAQKITDLHEDLMPNEPLAREMDLHNNRVGRVFFLKNKELSISQMVEKLQEQTESAVFVIDILEIAGLNEKMVYIEKV